MTTSGTDDYAAFRRALRRAAAQLARPLPWLGHRDPWAVLVSEVMLQQTQTSRVEEPWRRFLERFPTAVACADAPLSSVLRQWSGLGFNRRAKSLHEAARQIRDDHAGVVPKRVEDLRRLRGVGDYTASAVASFAFHERVAVLDTNVGRVLARALANRPLGGSEAKSMARELLGRGDSASFNQLMLDLGARYCRSVPQCATCPVVEVCRWRLEGGEDPAPTSAAVSRPQSRFEGSDRQVRGTVLGALREGPRSKSALTRASGEVDSPRLRTILEGLEREGMIEREGATWRLVGD